MAADMAAGMVGVWIANGMLTDASSIDSARLEAEMAELINDAVNDYGTRGVDTADWARRDLLDNDGLSVTQVLSTIPDLSFLSRDPRAAAIALLQNRKFQALLYNRGSTSDLDVASSSSTSEPVERLPRAVDLTLPVVAGLILLTAFILWCRDHLF
jgi:hypothetical protein